MNAMTPRTEAGKRLLADFATFEAFAERGYEALPTVDLTDPWATIQRRLAGNEGIPAIEAEAVAARNAEIVAAVRALDDGYEGGWGDWIERAAVLAIIDRVLGEP